VVRLADGGPSDDDNIILAHKTCNQDADLNPDNYLRSYTSESAHYQLTSLQNQLKGITAVGPDGSATVTDSDTQK